MSTDARDLYPLSEKAPHLVRSKTGLGLEDFTVDAVLEGRISAQDLAITPEALRLQADVARATDRDRLAEKFERAAELVAVPAGRPCCSTPRRCGAPPAQHPPPRGPPAPR